MAVNLFWPIIAGAVGLVVVSQVLAYLLWGRKTKGVLLSNKVQTKSTKLVTLVDPNTKYALPLIEREELSHDSRRFRFGLPSPQHVLGLPIGQHVHLSAKIGDDLVIRAYTPVSSDDEKGYVDLVIKVYFKNVNPRFPDGGKMSQYLNNMKLNDKIEFRGPSGKLQYLGNSVVQVRKSRDQPPVRMTTKKMNMIAGGTGISPMLQLVRHICRDPNDKTEMRLIYANQTEDDILLRNELDKYEAEYPEQFKVWYTIDKPKEGWKYSVGYINDDMIRDHLLPPSDDGVVFMCGPPPMVNFACKPALARVGYKEDLCLAY